MEGANVDTDPPMDRQRAMNFFRGLSAAPELRNFVLDVDWSCARLFANNMLPTLELYSLELVEALLGAVTHGCRLFVAEHQQLVSKVTRRHQWGISLLSMLMSFTVVFIDPRKLPNLSQSSTKELYKQLPLLVDGSGILQVLPELCVALATSITAAGLHQQPPPQQQQQRQRRLPRQQRQGPLVELHCCADLAGGVLRLLGKSGPNWSPPLGLLRTAFQRVVPAAADLATALLCCPSSTTAVSLPLDKSGKLARTSLQSDHQAYALEVVCALENESEAWLVSLTDAGRDESIPSVPLVMRKESCVWELLLIYMGLVVKALHAEQKGLSAALPAAAGGADNSSHGRLGRQQQAALEPQLVPCFHDQLLQAFGVTEGLQLPPGIQMTSGLVSRLMLMLTTVLIEAGKDSNSQIGSSSSSSDSSNAPGSSHSGHGSADISSSSSSSSSNRQQMGQQGQQAIWERSHAVLVPLVLVLLEVALLQPSSVRITIQAVCCLLEGLWQQLHRDGPTAKVPEQLATDVLPLMVQWVFPRLLHGEVVKDMSLAGTIVDFTAQLASVPLFLLENSVCSLTATVLEAPGHSDAAEAALIDFFQRCPEYGQLLEHMMRRLLHPSQVSLETTFHAGYTAANLAATAAASSAGGAEGAATPWLTSKGAQKKLFGLLMACLKIVGANSCSSSSDLQGAQPAVVQPLNVTLIRCVKKVVVTALQMFEQLADAHRAAASNCASSAGDGTGSGGSLLGGLQLPAVLLGRCVVVAGRLVQQHEPELKLFEIDARHGDEENFLLMLLTSGALGFSCLIEQLPLLTENPHASIAAAMQLNGAMSIWEMLTLSIRQRPAADRAPPTGADLAAAGGPRNRPGGMIKEFVVEPVQQSDITRDGFLERFGQTLETFGAAACALLPGKYCCNYHLCCNGDKNTEQEVVQGKGSVCSSCRTARYCSSACQKKHWLRWHKVECKKLAKQQQG